jgi:FeoA domain
VPPAIVFLSADDHAMIRELHSVGLNAWTKPEVFDELDAILRWAERLRTNPDRLGDPEVDPHGHLIPQKHGSAASENSVSLLDCPLGKPATIISVGDRNPAILRELQRLELMPKVSLLVERRVPNASLLVRVAGRSQPIRLSNEVAQQVMVVEDQ